MSKADDIRIQKEKLLHQVNAEAHTPGCRPWEVRLDMDELACLSLVGALQLAMRHPQFATRPTCKFVRRLVEDLIARIPPERAKLKELAELGFNKDFDE